MYKYMYVVLLEMHNLFTLLVFVLSLKFLPYDYKYVNICHQVIGYK